MMTAVKLVMSWLLGVESRPSTRRSQRRRPELEPLECRLAPAVLTVNSFADNTTADNVLTFREALMLANGGTGAAPGLGRALTAGEQAQVSGVPDGPSFDTIKFDIANAATTIPVGNSLPAIVKGAVIIDGTPPAGKPNQRIILDGTLAGASNGLELSTDSGGSTIKGITIKKFQLTGLKINTNGNSVGGSDPAEYNTFDENGIGIWIKNGSGNVLAGNTISNSLDRGIKGLVTGYGVLIDTASGNTVGKEAPVDPVSKVITTPANVITGNALAGVAVINAASGNNVIVGNFIGLASDGTTAQGNQLGIGILGAHDTVIGGANFGQRNIISASTKGPGVQIAEVTAVNNRVLGNFIGTTKDGTADRGNKGGGVAFDGNALKNKIKDTLIKYNKGAGVVGDPNKKNQIYDPNLISSNDYGIFNGTMAGTPVITSAVRSGSSFTISGTLDSTATTQFVLEFFGETVAERQGAYYLGTTTVITDGAGHASFSATLTPGTPFSGDFITATATDPGTSGGTSESSCRVAAP